MRDLYEKWIRTPSLRGQLIWLNVSSVLVTLLISLLILVLLVLVIVMIELKMWIFLLIIL